MLVCVRLYVSVCGFSMCIRLGVSVCGVNVCKAVCECVWC